MKFTPLTIATIVAILFGGAAALHYFTQEDSIIPSTTSEDTRPTYTQMPRGPIDRQTNLFDISPAVIPNKISTTYQPADTNSEPSTNPTTTSTPATQKETETQQQLRVYANVAGGHIIAINEEIYANRRVFSALATSTPSPTSADGIKHMSDLYKKLQISLAGVQAPATVAGDHATLVRDFEKIAAALESLSQSVREGNMQASLYNSYNESAFNSAKMMVNIAKTLKNYSVTIPAGESGYFFLSLIP